MLVFNIGLFGCIAVVFSINVNLLSFQVKESLLYCLNWKLQNKYEVFIDI